MQLFYRDGGEIYNFCGATLIAPMVLLTAAHCIKDESGGPDTVVSEVWIGVTNLNTDPPWAYEVRGVQRVIVHPEAVIGRFDIRNDVALVILDRPSSKQTGGCKIVRLAPYNPTPDPFPGLEVVVAGWGATPAEPDGTYQLQKATVHVLGKAQCIEWIDRQVPDGHMCAWDLKKDPCQGDSGGPLVTHHPANPRADVQARDWTSASSRLAPKPPAAPRPTGCGTSGRCTSRRARGVFEPGGPCTPPRAPPNGAARWAVPPNGPRVPPSRSSAQPASVGVYTSVSYYWPWIHQAMAPWAGIRAVSSPPPPPARYLPKPGLVQRPPPRYAAAAG
eukprot:scaffold7.g3740.t1